MAQGLLDRRSFSEGGSSIIIAECPAAHHTQSGRLEITRDNDCHVYSWQTLTFGRDTSVE